MQNNLPTKKRNTYKTKNLAWDTWRATDFVFVPLYIYQYAIKLRAGWNKGDTPKRRAFYALTEFLGRPPENEELKQVTRTPLMTHSPVYFALAVFAMNKGIPFESLEFYYFKNKAWKDARAQLRKALKLGVREKYVLKMSRYKSYVKYFSGLVKKY